MIKIIDTFGFDNVEQVRKWYLGIQSTFKQIQKQNNYSKKQAWDKLKIELFKSDKGKSFTKEEAIDLKLSKKEVVSQKLLSVQPIYTVLEKNGAWLKH